MLPTVYSVLNSGDHSLHDSWASSGPSSAVLPPKKVQRSEITPALPAIATDVAEGEVVAVDFRESEDCRLFRLQEER